MHDCFELETKCYLHSQYQVLIVDKHTSHIQTEFIQFSQEYRIVCLCLPIHSTYLLHSLNAWVFGSLKQN